VCGGGKPIQGDSGRKTNIFGGDSIGYYKKKGSYEHVYNLEWLPRERERELFDSTHRKAL
jgi:hypothetical protein